MITNNITNKDNKRLEYWEKINSDDRCLINAYTMEIIGHLKDHGYNINDNIIDKIQDTLVDFYKTIKE